MKYWTSIPVVLAVAVMAVCSYYLYREFTARVEKTGGEVIGTVTFKKRIASRRYSDSVVWEEIGSEAEIYNHDAIRTLEYSSAVIGLKDGTRIELDQNTLLVVVLSEKGLNINFDRGGVSAKSAEGGERPVILNSKDAVVRLEKGDIALNSSDSGMDIVVSKGEAKVEADGREIELTPDRIATVKNGVVESKKSSLFPIKPEQNSYILTFNNKAPVNFSWRSDPAGEVRVEISHSSSFARVAESFTSAGAEREIDLPAGDYYWRLVRGESKSFPFKFTVISDRIPVPLYPVHDQDVVISSEDGAVNFRWEGGTHSSGYEVMAARDRGMKELVVKLQSRVNTISAKWEEPGIYYWTVRGLYPPGIDGGESLPAPVKFRVAKRSFSLARPELFDTGPVTTGGAFTLKWRGVDGAESYTVEIAEDGEFKKNVLKRNTPGTFLKVDEKLSEGAYYWRVGALKGEKSSEKSAALPLIITRPVEILTVTPEKGSVLYNRPEKINFTWSDPNRGDKYIVEISERSDFSRTVMRLESNDLSVAGEAPGAGSYFWRVLLKDDTGKIIAKSSAAAFTIPSELRIPVLLSPGYNEKIIPGAKSRIRFEWKKIKGANEYEVEVFQRVAGVEKSIIVYTSKTNSIEASNLSLFRPGKFSWLVRAKRLQNGRVAAFRGSEKSLFEIEEVVLLPPPEIKEPGVLFK